VDDVSSIQAVQALALSQIPQHGNTVLEEGKGNSNSSRWSAQMPPIKQGIPCGLY
jgi:hypothetical protein